jgi:hypothetical protein
MIKRARHAAQASHCYETFLFKGRGTHKVEKHEDDFEIEIK